MALLAIELKHVNKHAVFTEILYAAGFAAFLVFAVSAGPIGMATVAVLTTVGMAISKLFESSDSSSTPRLKEVSPKRMPSQSMQRGDDYERLPQAGPDNSVSQNPEKKEELESEPQGRSLR